MRIALRFAYDGRFAGYARQPEGGTVEDHIIAALKAEGYVAGSWVTGSRTDKGVSAVANVAAVRLDRPHLKGLLPAIQKALPAGIWATGAAPVATDWNPRHAATRTYEYVLPAHGEDGTAMQAACEAFVGEHDMSAFARVDGRNPVRRVDACKVGLEHGLWRWRITAPNFLWNQVRRMVSATHAVGRGQAHVQDIVTALAKGRPQGRFPRLPAHGLLLVDVAYTPRLAWAAEAGPVGGTRWQTARQEAAVQARFFQELGPFMESRRPGMRT